MVGDDQRVVDVGAFGVGVVGAPAEVGDEVEHVLRRSEGDDLVFAAGLFGQAHGDAFAADEVGEDAVDADEVTDVGEFPDAGDRAQSAAGGVEFDAFDGGGERRTPGVDIADFGVGEQIRSEIGLHDPQLRQRVRHRGAGGEGGHAFDVLVVVDALAQRPSAALLAQIPELHVQVHRLIRTDAPEFLNVGVPVQVLEGMRLVDEQVVTARGFERQPRVFAVGVECGGEPFFQRRFGFLDLFDRLVVFGVDPVQRGDLAMDEFGVRRRGDAETHEHRQRHDHHVPVL